MIKIMFSNFLDLPAGIQTLQKELSFFLCLSGANQGVSLRDKISASHVRTSICCYMEDEKGVVDYPRIQINNIT